MQWFQLNNNVITKSYMINDAGAEVATPDRNATASGIPGSAFEPC